MNGGREEWEHGVHASFPVGQRATLMSEMKELLDDGQLMGESKWRR
jgi:hypothetical protein